MKYTAMRPILVLLVFFISISLTVTAQEFIPFGELAKEEIEMKQCSFDPEAEAIVLLDEALSDYDDSYHLVTKHHLRIKILKEKGISNADISLRFWRKDDFEEIYVSRAETFNAAPGEIPAGIRVDRKSIFKRNINERIGEVVFTFPSVKVGSILEYEYESKMKNYGGLEDWYFQEQRPVLHSKYNLVIVPNTEFTYQLLKRPDFDAIVTPNSNRGSVYFEMKNIPGLRNEPYMDSRKDYLQKVTFQLSAYGRGDGFGGNKYMTSWDEVIRELLSNSGFGGMTGKNIPGTDDFIKQVTTISSEIDRMKKVYDYVRSNINWNHIYSRFADDGLKSAWQKKSGTSAEINFILISLLKEAGLEVYPALVSERWHGRVNTAYPFIDQFNSVFACVKIKEETYYLDATDKFTPAHVIPYDILNTTALLVRKKTGGLVKVVNESLQYRESFFTALKIAADGSVEGSTKVSSAEYARVKKLEQYAEGRNDFLKTNFRDAKLPVEVVKFEVENINDDSLVFSQTCNFTAKLGATGDYSFIPLNLFSGFTQNPFVSNNRFSNVNFGYRRSITITTEINLPAEFNVEELPKGVRLSNPEKDIVMIRSAEYSKEQHKITAAIRIDFSKSLYEIDEYDVLQAFYKKMFEYLDEPVLLKKK